MAREAVILKHIHKYRIYKYGVYKEEVLYITEYWKYDMDGFLIGCSFTFETPLLENGIPIQHIEENCNVPMYRTNIACEKSGLFEGPTVVSMRPMSPRDAIRATQITSRLPPVQGAPIHVGDLSRIGLTVM